MMTTDSYYGPMGGSSEVGGAEVEGLPAGVERVGDFGEMPVGESPMNGRDERIVGLGLNGQEDNKVSRLSLHRLHTPSTNEIINERYCSTFLSRSLYPSRSTSPPRQLPRQSRLMDGSRASTTSSTGLRSQRNLSSTRRVVQRLILRPFASLVLNTDRLASPLPSSCHSSPPQQQSQLLHPLEHPLFPPPPPLARTSETSAAFLPVQLLPARRAFRNELRSATRRAREASTRRLEGARSATSLLARGTAGSRRQG
jgi:hypothetical protein